MTAPRTKTQLLAQLRKIIETPDLVHPVVYPGQGFDVKTLVDVERLKALLVSPTKVTLDGDRDGVTYDPELDFDRLNRQMKAVWTAVRDGRWWTLTQISHRTGMPEASVSARLRDLRKPKFGSQVVERRRASNGLWQYRVVRERP